MTRTETKDDDKLANARAQGQAQFDSIAEMVEALNKARDAEAEEGIESAERAIHEDALSVEVRGGWHTPGCPEQGGERAEYRILLCTGGPAVQIRGDLNDYSEPETAWLEVQDWFTPWVEFWPKRGDDSGSKGDSEEILLAYARCFWFGE
jgi:hypothetical protein